MCCEMCHRYDECSEGGRLRDNCCPRCQEYSECFAEEESEENFR